jgi:hypothetical protein
MRLSIGEILILLISFFYTGQRNIGTGFEELFPELPRDQYASELGRDLLALDPSHTAFECSAYCSTIGKILEVTIRCARLKLWSISIVRQPATPAHKIGGAKSP